MELDLQNISQELRHANLLHHINNGLPNHPVNMPVACGLCGRTLSLEDEVDSGLQNASICDDCKFLMLEDTGTPAHNSIRRRLPGRRQINGNSDSIENFSQQFSQIINLARHIEPYHEDVYRDTDPNVMLLQPASSRTTPNGSSRWRRIFSDSESDGFNSDSFYGESDSNVSIGAHRVYHGDSDAVSFSTYEGDSVTSVDGNTYFDPEIYVRSVERSDIDSDTDIDPMHAGIVQWNSDEDEVEDGEWGEVDAEENTVRPQAIGAHIDSTAGSAYFVERSRTEFEEFIRQRIREAWDRQNPSIPVSMEVFNEAPYSGDFGDYVDELEFDDFLDHLAENDSLRRGAPPAAASFINKLPLVAITDEHQKPDGLACAICKDFLVPGIKVNQLPCFHLYHPSCILPWLSARNSCPLCRYELPTDDRDYEMGKRHASHRMVISRIQQQADRDDSSSVTTDMSLMDATLGDVHPDLSHTNSRRARWFFLAAAPVVSLVGIVFVLWLGNPLTGLRGNGQPNFHGWPPRSLQISDSCPHNQRKKRWWWWF